MNVTRHDTNFTFSRLRKEWEKSDGTFKPALGTVQPWTKKPEVTYIDDSGAVGAHQAGLALPQQPVFDPHHVLLGDALSDANHQGHLCINGLVDGSSSKRGRDIYDSG